LKETRETKGSIERNFDLGRRRKQYVVEAAQKSKVKKIQCPFYLSEEIVDAIAENCRDNKSVFEEEVLKFYFDQNGIEY